MTTDSEINAVVRYLRCCKENKALTNTKIRQEIKALIGAEQTRIKSEWISCKNYIDYCNDPKCDKVECKAIQRFEKVFEK